MNLTEQLNRDGNLLKREPRPPKSKKRKRLNPVSKKRGEALKFYAVVRGGFLAKHPVCEAGPRWGHIFKGCTKRATQIHHKKRRGPHLCDTRYFLAICAPCHRFLESHANLSRTLGLLQ